MRYTFNPITETLETPDNPSPMYDNLGKKFKLAESVLPYDFDDLSPKEEQYYQQDQFSTHPEFLAAEGGRVGFQDGSEKKKYPQTYRLVEGTEYIYKRKSLTTGKVGTFIVEITYYPLKKDFEPVKYTKTFVVDEHGGIAKALAAAKAHLPQAKKMISAEVGLPFKDILDYTKTRERRARFQLPKGKKHYLNTTEFAKALTKLGLPANKMIHQKLYSYKEGTSEWIGPILKKLFDPTTIRKEGSKMKSGNMFWKPPTEADIPKLKPYITYGGEGKGEGFLKKKTLNNLRDLHTLPYIKNLRKRRRPLDLRNKAVIKFARQKNLTPSGLLWLFRQLSRRYKGEVIPGLEYIPVNKPFGKILGKNIIDLFDKPFADPYWRGMNQLRYLIEADYLADAGEFKEAERYKEFSKKAELTKFRGQAEHGLGVGAVRAGLAPRDTLIKINAFLDPKVNSWKGVNFDMALFGKEALLDKYNNARSKLGILETPEQKILKQKILERFEWMRKRAPKLIDMIELNWEGNQVSARSNTPALDTLTKEQRIKLHADGMKESQRIIKSQGVTEKGTALKTGFKDTGYKLNKNLKVPVPKGTVGSFASAAGVPLFGIASGAMYQEGRPKKDILLGLPVEFGTFGIVPVTDMMQKWRIRDDLKLKGLSFKERNEAMIKYNQARKELMGKRDPEALVDSIDKEKMRIAVEHDPLMTEGALEEALAIREDEEKRLLDTKIQRGYDEKTGTWPDKDPIAFEEAMFAEGGIVPRVAYRDGSNWLDKLSDDDVANLGRGWKRDYKMDPDVMDRIKQKQILDAQAANEAGFKHRSQYEDTGSFIPEYVQDVVKKGFGTKEGLKYMGSKAGEGAVEGFEWFIYQLPHLVKELDKRGLMPGLDGQNLNKMKKHLEKNKGKFNWMELMYHPNWGEEFLGFKMNDFQKEQIQKLKDRFGETEIPEGIASTGTAAELGAMFAADPFIIWGAGSKLSKLKGKKDKLVNVDETIDIGRRDFNKSVGAVGLTAFLATAFPFLFKAKKNITAAKNVAKVAETVKQFGNVRGMPDWLPSFILKAKNKGTLKSLPDKDYIEPLVYEIMLPVKRRYYTSTNKDRGVHIKSDPDGNPITSKGEKDHWGATGKHTETRIEKVPVTVTHNPNTGEMTVSWTGTDNFGDDIERSFNYRAGETGSQNYAIDETGKGVSKERVVVEEPEFQYTEPDWSSAGPDDTPDSASYLDAYDDADEIVEAMEEYVKGVDDKFKTKAANDMTLYNETDIHYGDADGTQNIDGDWIEGENNLPIKGVDDKHIKDVYHPNWEKMRKAKIRKKKAMGGVASGPPPLSGPVPEGLRSLKPGAIYNEWIK